MMKWSEILEQACAAMEQPRQQSEVTVTSFDALRKRGDSGEPVALVDFFESPYPPDED